MSAITIHRPAPIEAPATHFTIEVTPTQLAYLVASCGDNSSGAEYFALFSEMCDALDATGQTYEQLLAGSGVRIGLAHSVRTF
jgi:hypothetical protein